MQQNTELNAALAALGFTCESVFIPFHLSRNAKEKNLTLNWRCTLKLGEREIRTFDYSAGVGNIPDFSHALYSNRMMYPGGEYRSYIANITKTGRYNKLMFRKTEQSRALPYYKETTKYFKLDTPDLASLLYCFVADSVDETFADWCASLGYSDDSMKAKAIYDACVEQTMEYRNSVPKSVREAVAALLEDF